MRNTLWFCCILMACGGNASGPAQDSGTFTDDVQPADSASTDSAFPDGTLSDAPLPDAGVDEPDGALPDPDGGMLETCGTAGDILVVDRSNDPEQIGLKRFAPDGTALGLFAAQNASGPLHIPLKAVQLKDCQVLVTDIGTLTGAVQIRTFNADGMDQGQFWVETPSCNPRPLDLFVQDEDSLVVGFQSIVTGCGAGASSLWKFSTSGEILDTSWNTGEQVALDYYSGTGFGRLSDGNILAISNGCNFPPGGGFCEAWTQVERFNTDGVWLSTFNTLPEWGTALLVRSTGDILVAYYAGTGLPYGIRRFSAAGEDLGLWSDLADVTDLVEREDGTILAATDFGGTVEQLGPDGASLGALIYPPQVSRPHGLLILR